MENYRIEANAVQEAQAQSKFVEFGKDGASHFDDCELCGLRGVGRRGENAKVTFNFALGTNGIEQTSDSIL